MLSVCFIYRRGTKESRAGKAIDPTIFVGAYNKEVIINSQRTVAWQCGVLSVTPIDSTYWILVYLYIQYVEL